jgi:hypothetical protein
MSYYQSKKSKVERRKQSEQTQTKKEVLLLRALAETNADPAANHSQDADRHHRVSHERLAKQRNDFEHKE